MGKSQILFLSLFLITICCSCQTREIITSDCSDKIFKDSLINRFIINGCQKVYYNDSTYTRYCDSLIYTCSNIAIAYQQKAIPMIKSGDYANAFASINIAVKLEPKNYTAYRGFLKCIFTKDYNGAIIDFTTAKKYTQDGFEMDHTYLFYIGLCHLELKNYKLSEQNLNADITMQTNTKLNKSPHFNSMLYLGILYYEMKETKKACEWLLKSLNIYPNSPEANYYLALVYKKTNNTQLYLKHLMSSKDAIISGYSLNEDNEYYVYYPHQITLFDIEKEAASIK
jgi:tetratricopeptide (TPR) repeat protein